MVVYAWVPRRLPARWCAYRVGTRMPATHPAGVAVIAANHHIHRVGQYGGLRMGASQAASSLVRIPRRYAHASYTPRRCGRMLTPQRHL